MSSLNPNAASYIPLNKREENIENQFSNSTSGSSQESADKPSSSSSPFKSHSKTDLDHFLANFVSDLNIHDTEGSINEKDLKMKGEQNLSCQLNKQHVDEETELDLAYIASLFPDISEQSLADVYFINGADVDDAIDMLYELEFNPNDFNDMPESSKNGEASESKVPAEGSSSSGPLESGT